ncbi:MAG: ATP-binding protein [Aliishimia sp.]
MTMMEKTPLPLDGKDQDLVHIAPSEPNSELEEFVYIVSHDLRNSARALGEVPQWLRSDLISEGVELTDDMRDDFDLLERHARRLDRMFLDLLVFSRVGRLQEISKFSLTDLMDRVVAESAVPDHVNIEYPRDLPEVTLGYKDGYILLKCVVDNLLQHCGKTGARLQMSAERHEDLVTLDFHDNGPGVALRDLHRMFRPMTTLRRRDEVEGSGMGLATVQRIARHYGGGVYAGIGSKLGGLHLRVTINDAGLRPTDRFDGLDYAGNT